MENSPNVTDRKRDISSWQVGDISQLSTREKKRYNQRKAAIKAYFTTNATLDEISQRYRLSKSVLRLMVEKCLELHEDGSPWGFRALLPGVSVVAHDDAPQPAVEVVAKTLEEAYSSSIFPGDRLYLGSQPLSKYRLLRKIGHEALGEIYLGEDAQFRHHAIIIFHQSISRDVFFKGARKLAELKHPNIVQLQDFGSEDGNPHYLVFNNLLATSLQTRHPKGSILPLTDIISYAKQFAAALQYAHNHQIIHDAVQPKNMFLGINDEVLLGGFENLFAFWYDSHFIYTDDVIYYAPEYLVEGKNTFKSNQYSLATIVYEWLSGDIPFHGDLEEILLQQIKVTPPSLREKNSAIPHEVEEVVMKALAKDPEQRYESVQEFAAALEEAILPPKTDRFVLPDRSGEQFGKYILVRRLGQGGFAEVYLGQHITLKKNFVAIKILYAHLSVKQLEGLDAEAQIIAGMQHPSIVRVIDIDIERNIRYLVMDYAPKGTMRQFHARGSRLSLPTVVKYVKQIADALQHAHDQKIIHRDVKPENMLIGANGTIMLSDFGLAMIAHNTKSWKEQDRAGTAKYMAPEQYRRKAIPASDQYSLAVTAYEWLCGVPPFYEGEDDIQLVLQHLQDPIPPMSERGAVVSEEVEQVILKALAKGPTERFGSVKEFADELAKAAQVD